MGQNWRAISIVHWAPKDGGRSLLCKRALSPGDVVMMLIAVFAFRGVLQQDVHMAKQHSKPWACFPPHGTGGVSGAALSRAVLGICTREDARQVASSCRPSPPLTIPLAD